MFLAAVLLALASALVPALFPTGSASPRQAGSAFDPTTSAVALRGRAQVIVHAEAPADDGLGKAATPDLALLAARGPREVSHVTLEPVTTGPALNPATSLAPRRVTRAQPRAPPHTLA